MVRIMAVCAHADDEVIGCGGTLLKHYQEGDTIHIVYMTREVTSRGIPFILKREKDEVAKWLAGTYSDYPFPDQELDAYSILDLNKAIENEIEIFKPDIIYSHSLHDANRDHQAVFKSVKDATPAHKRIKAIYLFEVPQARCTIPFQPAHFVDISHQMKLKTEMFKIYEKEMKEWPHPRSEEGLRVTAQVRGLGFCDYAEGFEIFWEFV
jgi:N-acetylglucosamine malate deacetylase 1